MKSAYTVSLARSARTSPINKGGDGARQNITKNRWDCDRVWTSADGAGSNRGAYLGKSSTIDSNVQLNQPDGTDLDFHGVGWYDESWVNPKYYGFRLSYWNRNAPRWGFVVDFTHAKMYAELDATVRVTGSREGEPVDGEELLGDTFDSLSISHGHNTLTFNGFHR